MIFIIQTYNIPTDPKSGQTKQPFSKPSQVGLNSNSNFQHSKPWVELELLTRVVKNPNLSLVMILLIMLFEINIRRKYRTRRNIRKTPTSCICITCTRPTLKCMGTIYFEQKQFMRSLQYDVYAQLPHHRKRCLT